MTKEGYSSIYEALSEMREAFHRFGRMDDSNAKLDEVAKLFASYLAFKRGRIQFFPRENDKNLVQSIKIAFKKTAFLKEYTTNNKASIFGVNPSIALSEADEPLARELISVVRRAIDVAFTMQSRSVTFDVLNEAFGHFVRDNFRSNIEDAQYMTPPEVVDFMVDLAITDLLRDWEKTEKPEQLTVMDPTCGVGSFLTAFHNRARQHKELRGVTINLVGQDKVQRMVRLTALNMALFDVDKHQVTSGNSLEKNSPIDKYNGKVDLILTNPPFAARFGHDEVKMKFRDNTAFFSSMVGSTAKIDSELLFLDRAFSLLKPGGLLLVVVPDAVISAKGIPALLRHYIQSHAELRAIIELPAVTFAQAGTRTRTGIIVLKKTETANAPWVFFAQANDLGFHVSSRKGIQIKVATGTNELLSVLQSYRRSLAERVIKKEKIISKQPSAVIVPSEKITHDAWTPSHYSADRIDTVRSLNRKTDFDVVRLGDVAELLSDARRAEKYASGTPYISVLHVIGEGIIDVKNVHRYAPKTPGIPLFPGELVFSKINPHITRVAVIPHLAKKMLCSSEFEILKAKSEDLNEYGLAYLMHSTVFLNQVAALTSGTSSSHNRIRSEQLANIMLAIPRKGTKYKVAFDHLVLDYKKACQRLADAILSVSATRSQESEIFAEEAIKRIQIAA